MFRNLPVAAFVAGLLAVSAIAQQPSSAPQQPTTATPAPQTKSVEIPSGTKVLLSLRSAINTKTAKAGDSVYLSSSFPVVVDSHVAIPAGVYVQGVIDQVTRPGRVKGRAAVRMHFTSMIFPNGSVVNIPGVVNSLPGSDGPKVQDDEGTIQQASNKGKDLGTIAQGTIEGASIGTIGGGVAGHPAAGGLLDCAFII